MACMSQRIQDLPEDDRPRERIMRLGATSLTNPELIAIFINTGLQGENAIQVAERLLRETRTLRNLSRMGAKELARVHGLGPAKAAHIAAAFELGRRAAVEEVMEEKMDEPEKVYRYLFHQMAQQGHETLHILVLNTKLGLVHDETVFKGTVNESPAHPREIMRIAAVHRAHSFILAHNHPSGDPTPSEMDRRFTQRIRQCAEIMQIQFADHIIIGSPSQGRQPWFSFRSAGLL